MDATLKTQSEENSLSMHDIEIFSDGSGGRCDLNLRSLPFQAQITFYFDCPSLSEFADQLRALEFSLIGTARLGNLYEEPYVEFEGNGRGGVKVSGRLQVSGDHIQQLDFEFSTDQTALGSFIYELKEALVMQSPSLSLITTTCGATGPHVSSLMNFRPAHEYEASTLSALAAASKEHWPYTSSQLAIWQEALTITPEMIRSFPTFVAELNQEIVGFFVLIPEGIQWKLEHFWIHPLHMRQGHGKSMLAEAASIAAQGGATALLIESDPNAEPFYLACGARRIGELSAPIDGAAEHVLPVLQLSITQAKHSNLS
ncbi:MAG: GNAT family N-acetyltransferase [Pseudomonadota bacterium]